MGFFLLFFLFVGFTVLGELLRPKPKFGEPRASSLGDFQVPTAEEGRPIPVAFGTVNLKGANVLWYGDLHVNPIRKSVKTGLFTSKKITTGYRYYLGQQLGLCHGLLDGFSEVRFDDRSIPGGSITIDNSNDGIRFGIISPDTLYTAHIAHGVYTDMSLLADAAQAAMRSAYGGGNWRVVWGFDIRTGICDEFKYKVHTAGGGDSSTVTINVAAGLYNSGATLAAALESALNAAEAGVSGGPRIRWKVRYGAASVIFGGAGASIKKKRFTFTYEAARPGFDEVLFMGALSGADVDKSILACIGGTFGYDRRIRAASGGFTCEHEAAPFCFMFSWSDVNGKLDVMSPAFTATSPLGIRKEIPAQRGGIPFRGYNVEQKLVDIVAGGSGAFNTGDTCSPAIVGTALTLLDDPGDTGTWTIRLRATRSGTGTAGEIDITMKLYATDMYAASNAGTLVASKVAILTALDPDNFTDFALTLSAGEIAALRSNGGFSAGAALEAWASFAGIPNQCSTSFARYGSFSLEVPTPTYIQLRHFVAQEQRAVNGVRVVDHGDYWDVNVTSPDMFGGDEREGGVQGLIRIYKGTTTQNADPYLVGLLGSLPGYRSLAYAVMGGASFNQGFFDIVPSGFYIGTTPYLKNVSFVVRRLPNSLGLPNGQENISGDANPAAMLYDLMTNDHWGLGIAPALIAIDSFLDAGETLATEGFGMSVVYDTQSSARDMIDSILRHIDGVIFPDPSDGLIKITLARANYGPGDPIMIDENRIASCNLSRPSIEDTRNVVKVSYTERAGFVERVVQAQNRANIEERGGEISEEEYQFFGISNAPLAQKVAARVLKTVSYPLAAVTLTVDRIGWTLRPGSVFRFSWSPLGITNLICRVLRISTGTLLSGKIKIDAVEDVFATDWTAFSAPSSAWVDPIAAPTSLSSPRLVECPYALVVGSGRLVMTLAGQGASISTGYKVWSDPVGGDLSQTNDIHDLTPIASLIGTMYHLNDTMTVTPVAGMSAVSSPTAEEFAAGFALALIDDEIVAYQGVADNGDGTRTISGIIRGVLDTVPAVHGDNSIVYFLSIGAGLVSPDVYGADVSIRAKLLAYNSLGSQTLADVSQVTLTTNSRAQRPYAPRDVKVNFLRYPTIIPSGTIQVSWTHRNRLSEWSYQDGGATSSPESGCTYNLRFYGRDGLLKRSYTGLSTTVKEWDTEAADSGGSENEIVTIELECVNASSQVSYQKFVWSVCRMTAANTPQKLSNVLPIRRRARVKRVLDSGGDGGWSP